MPTNTATPSRRAVTASRTVVTHKYQRRWHSSTRMTTTASPAPTTHRSQIGGTNSSDGRRNVVISEACHSVCDMMSATQVARGCESDSSNNYNGSQRIASIANEISNNNKSNNTTTDATNKHNNNNNINTTTSNSNNMNTLTAFSRNPISLASVAAAAVDGDDRRLHVGIAEETANKHKLPLRRNYKLTAIMPKSTSYYITLLLAAVILGTDLAGSEMDALAKPLHESSQALAIELNTIEMPIGPPLTSATSIIQPTTTITTTNEPLSTTIHNNTKDMLASSSVSTTTATTTTATTTIANQNPSTKTLLTRIIATDNAKNFHATTSTIMSISAPTSPSNSTEPPAQTSLASHEDPNTSQSSAEIAYSLSAEDSDNGDDIVIDSDGTVLVRPPSDSLTHGFSIPTYLPPFPEFDVADLPAYAAAASTTTTTTTTTEIAYDLSAFEFGEDGSMHGQDQMYMNALSRQQLRRNSTMPAVNVTVQMGNHAYLPCNIRRFMNKPVSWVRVRDGHILSVDQTPFIADQRFQSIFKGENEYTWSLQIKYVQDSDAGWYECQVSTEPKMSAKVFLSVVVPITELIGDQNRFVKAGSKVALHCIVRGTLEPPTYIIWFRGKTQITDDNKMGWYTQIDRTIFGNVSDNENTIGSLIIPFVRKKDSGNYTCQPSNSQSVSVDLHVLSGEYSASAIMSGARQLQLNANYFFVILTLMALHET